MTEKCAFPLVKSQNFDMMELTKIICRRKGNYVWKVNQYSERES